MLLALQDIHKSFPSSGEAPILDGISLNVDAGESVSIVGPSGSGKSTLLNIIGALDRPSSGRVLLDGRDLARLGDAELAAIRNRDIGFVFQLHHLMPQLTVLENVLLPTLASRSKATPEERERALQLCERVGLGHRAGHRPAQLSGGQRQRVALARALINRPRLLLADEPTGSLDQHTAEDLAALLMDVNQREGVALIVVTHWPELARRAKRRLVLHLGRLTEAGDGA